MDSQQTHSRKITALATAVASSLLLVACGGGNSDGGGGSSTPSKEEQTITFPAIETMAVGDSATLAATASSKLAVIYASTTPEICSVDTAEGDKKDAFMVKALATGNCTITANQAGNSSFAAAKAVSITTPVVGTEVTVNVPDTIEPDAASTTITISGKPVSDSLTAMLGDAELSTPKSTGKYTAEVAVTSEDIAKVGMVGDVTLTIKDGDKLLKEQLLNIALPKATGDSFTVKKTGYTECANLDDNHIDCKDKDKLGEGEDGFYATNQDGEIQAGVNGKYIKVGYQPRDNNGVIDSTKEMQYCVYDATTGLMWEQKTDTGLQNKANRYTWYNDDYSTNGGDKGVEIPTDDEGKTGNDTMCHGTLDQCNTKEYLKALNESNYCGHNNWRLPNHIELIGLRDFGKTTAPFADPVFNLMPNMKADDNDYKTVGSYLTSSSLYADPEYKEGYQRVMNVEFSNDERPMSAAFKNGFPHYVIAVR